MCVYNNYTACIYSTEFMQVDLHFSRPISLLKTCFTLRGKQEINFIYFGNKESYCTFNICCIISVYIPQNVACFVILPFAVRLIFMFIINRDPNMQTTA
jgi:serine protease inhibitor ecotin